jgi:hypothetical protein
MASRTRNSMKVSNKKPLVKERPAAQVAAEPAEVKPKKEASASKAKPARKQARKKTKITSPEDAILASAAVDPDLEKATKKKTASTKAKVAPSKTARTRKTAPKKAKTKKTKA